MASAVVIKPCKLCHSFLHDHLSVAADVTFKKRARRARASPCFEDAIQEISKAMDTCNAYPQFYQAFLDQCKTMEEFHGRAATMDIVFTQQPIFMKVYSQMECSMFDSGLGKLSEIGPWIREQVYIIFQELLCMHKEHTKEVPAQTLGPPLLFKPMPKPSPAAAEKVESDDWELDDLYA